MMKMKKMMLASRPLRIRFERTNRSGLRFSAMVRCVAGLYRPASKRGLT
ncbi:hypothetical protein [Bradyrhizobium yuanmingense]|uniref:Uncharacterized protein n=1 Tax=Bradyrhizobium yuanmingense TaxID=108015 RepID=A0ABV4G9B3_9BRAD|nr:hypothetical protein [Bradyrhizobium yuanmingense]